MCCLSWSHKQCHDELLMKKFDDDFQSKKKQERQSNKVENTEEFELTKKINK